MDTENKEVMDIADLMTLDLEGVEAKYDIRLQPGKYLMKVADAELDTIDTEKDGVIPVVKWQFEVVKCVDLDKDTDEDGEEINLDTFVGAMIYNTSWLRDQLSQGKLVGFIKSVTGSHPKGGLNDVLSTMKTEDTFAIMRVNHRKNKDNPSMPYVNLSTNKKEIIGHAMLVEQGVIGG